MAERINIKNFSLKFIDIMIGVILGLGFQWWTDLREPWQFVAFAFVYLDIVDFWIDYGPALKKFPPKKEIDIFLDLAICFAMFLYIYSTQYSVIYFIMAFTLLKIIDFLWLLSSKLEYQPTGFDKKYVDTWMLANGLEIILAAVIILLASIFNFSSLVILAIFIIMRVGIRIFASYSYKKVYLSN
ncbi:hypothetical protein EPO05_01595 [Patescibacteria group bacterium]|nr:MAG: hypothetical protein EPO05_01595 [Patescibacteria group bacterium]